MRFGRSLDFDKSGENNLTRGIAPQMYPSIEFDANGHPRYISRRNHPCVLQQPYSFPWYNANNDVQIFLTNPTRKDTLEKLGQEGYEKFTRNLFAAGMGGLEHHYGIDIIENM